MYLEVDAKHNQRARLATLKNLPNFLEGT